MSGASLPATTQLEVKSYEQLLQEQESINAADVYHELSTYAVEGSALSICLPKSDTDPDYSQRLARILHNLESLLARMPEGSVEVRNIDWHYQSGSFDVVHFMALAERAHDFVVENVMGHFEEQRHENDRDDLLDISNCEPPLPFVPRSISALRSLTSLNLQDNILTELPQELFDLEPLKELHLAGNRLKSIPEAIGRLRYLSVLNVDHNRLESLPRALENLTNLETLRAANNRLSSFSVHIEKLDRLRSVYLYRNEINSMTVYPALQLACLHLEDNRLTRFPDFRVLPYGCQIYLSGNPLQNDKTTMFQNEAIKVYFVGYLKPELGKKRPAEDEVSNRQ